MGGGQVRVKRVRDEMYTAAMKTVVIYIFSSSDSSFNSNEDIICVKKKDFKMRVTEKE